MTLFLLGMTLLGLVVVGILGAILLWVCEIHFKLLAWCITRLLRDTNKPRNFLE